MNFKKYKIIVSILSMALFFNISVDFICSKSLSICIIKGENIKPYDEALEGFLEVLQEKASKKKDNLVLSYYKFSRNIRDEHIIKEIKNKKPHLILTIGTNPTRKIKKEIKKIPVVFSMVLAPVANGLVRSMRYPGNNLTGASMDVSLNVQFKKLNEILPRAKKIGVIYDAQKTGKKIKRAVSLAKKYNLKLIKAVVSSPGQVPGALESIIKKIDVLWIVIDKTVVSERSLEYMLAMSLKKKIPVMGPAMYMVKKGALFSLSCDYEDIGRQSGELAWKILKGKKTKNLAVTLPRKTHFVINIRVAKKVKVDIPEILLKDAYKIFK